MDQNHVAGRMYALQNSMTFTIDWGALDAGVVLMLVPALVIFEVTLGL